MQTEQIIQLIETVAASGLTEFEYSEGDVRLTLKSAPPVCVPVPAVPSVQLTKANAPADRTVVSANYEAVPAGDEKILKSPLVGTFYSAPAEDAKPYAAVGDTVKKGQVLGLIETMKLMNEVECDRDGVITAVLIENEQVVEYGQPLFAIE